MAFISIPTSIGGINVPGKIGNLLSGPLAKLFGSDGLATLRYPLDLGNSATKLHYVQFMVSEVIPADVSNVPGEQAGKRLGLPGIDQVGQGISDLLGEFTSAIGVSADPVNPGGLGIGSSITDFTNWLSKGIQITPRMTKLKAVISLYMPDTIDASYNSDYVDMSLTQDLGKTTDLRLVTQLAGSVAGSITKDLPASLRALGGIASTHPEVVELATRMTGTDNLGSVILKGQGYAINPQLQMIYKGIDLRSFQLVFTFTPKSKQEAKEVNDILFTFKHHYTPRLQAGKETSVNSMFLIPPSIFRVNFMHDGQENPTLPKYGDCVLTNMDINYTPNGFASYQDGSPVQIMLSLSFRETEILDQDRINLGYKEPQNPKGLR